MLFTCSNIAIFNAALQGAEVFGYVLLSQKLLLLSLFFFPSWIYLTGSLVKSQLICFDEILGRHLLQHDLKDIGPHT